MVAHHSSLLLLDVVVVLRFRSAPPYLPRKAQSLPQSQRSSRLPQEAGAMHRVFLAILGSARATRTTPYTRGSAFEANLDAPLSSSLPTVVAASSGFAENTTGAATTNQPAYGLAQCRADVNASVCRSGMTGNVMCSFHDSDECLLRYSNASFFGELDTAAVYYMWSPYNATDPDFRSTLMSNLTTKAAYGSPTLFAVSSVAAPAPPAVNIYSMVLCRRDLAADDCNQCLIDAVNIPVCSIRFEVYRFYNPQAAEPPRTRCRRRRHPASGPSTVPASGPSRRQR
ncbi:hypothetical protein HU200_026893 [Digitaria exilis]|uniref:Gnk2-homologous domain-containing protein n=1 Tax=Digitaria exilis TaxID=1010633 RepID=A0A835EVC7_9POAL|nr:hypothetical protein HU200_026893 [Digitaria exilis]